MISIPRAGALVLSLVAVGFASRAADDNPDPSPADVRGALAKSTAFMRSIAVEGGYVWRWSTDLKERAGEEETTPTQIWVQPPGTPAVGAAFLRAYAATGDLLCLQAARDAAEALARGQLESGGWDYRIEFDPEKRAQWHYRIEPAPETAIQAARRRSNRTTFDDDNTQSVLRFLLAFVDAAKAHADPRDERIRDALDYGLRRLFDAQYPIGAWPQRWDGDAADPTAFPVKPASFPADYPREQPKDGYFRHYTLNDNTHRDCVLTLLEAHRRTGRQEFRDAARRAVDFLVLAQLPEPQPAWAQQYDAAMHPAWARAFEPPAITAAESGNVVRLLIDMYLEFGDERYLQVAAPAVAWLKRSEIAPGRWARLYELQTNRPLYGDRDGRIHYSFAEISAERQSGYGWEGAWNIPEALEFNEQVRTNGRDAMLQKRAAAETRPAANQARRLASRVKRILADLDEQGRWLGRARGGGERRIESLVFIRNVETLCDYLAAVEAK